MRPVLPLRASSASTLAVLTSSFMPACLLKRSSAFCDTAFQLPSAVPVLQPTRRSSACNARLLSGGGLLLLDLLGLHGSEPDLLLLGLARSLGRSRLLLLDQLRLLG